ncbi:TonB-dependent receptor [Shewanella cyperi]|uniref:TonB-dependent receptor n=1 Tax=Shewanella cyperi TaxID=2814292 RepID=A0A975ALJ7_9GAMM|nr:TonB-dependent receptor [Shewanella cyperi]QSX30482.1 TonB-dependent receptor [Shewanella cyperi]
MNTFPSLLSLALLTTSAAATTDNTEVQTAPDGATSTMAIASPVMERISITANRKQNVDTDLAMSLDSISKSELALDKGQHPAESLNSVAGVLIDQLGGGQGHKTAIRMPMNTSGYYLFLQDNIPIQSPAFFNHNGLWWSSFNTNVGRIEVIKGAGTALYGSGAVAATINVLSDEVEDANRLDSGLMLGSDNFHKLQLGYNRKPEAGKGWRISASAQESDGWQEHTATQRAEVNARHEYEIDANQRLVTLLSASTLEQEMAAGLTEEQYRQDRNQSGLSDAVLAVDPTRRSDYLRLSSQWDKQSGDANYSLIGYLRRNTNSYTATWNANMPMVDSVVRSAGLLALANWVHGDDSETTVGADLEYSVGDESSFQPLDVTVGGYKPDSFVAGERFYDDTTDYLGLSPYVQHQRPLTENLTLTLGARFDYAGYDYHNHLAALGDIGHGKLSIADREDSFSHLSPKASLNYRLGDSSSLYLRYANSFRLPTSGSLYHITTKDSTEGLSNLKPEISDTYELGYKANLDSLSWDLALYYMDVDDGIVNAFDSELGFRYQVNATRVIHKGLELAADWQATRELALSLAFTRASHEFDDYPPFTGNQMMNAPEYITNVRARYNPDALEGLSLMLEWQAIGDYWMDDANSRRYEGYQLTNLKARYKINDRVSINARATNLWDKDYVQSAALSYGKANINPGAPRSLYLGVDVSW